MKKSLKGKSLTAMRKRAAHARKFISKKKTKKRYKIRYRVVFFDLRGGSMAKSFATRKAANNAAKKWNRKTGVIKEYQTIY